MMRFAKLMCILCSSALFAAGCGKSEPVSAPEGSDSKAVVEIPARVPSPGGAPIYGKSSGMGFATGDSIHNDGQGSGLMGFNHTGEAGTSGAITDRHDYPKPPATTEPVLPAQ